MDKQQDKIRGSLVGGAIGDALGYPVEFIYSTDGIRKRYGENGITRLDTSHGKAHISDDTQMTLYTACGLLNGTEKEDYVGSIRTAYVEWFLAQTGRLKPSAATCWISGLREMHDGRAPGLTCMDSLSAICCGQEAENDSKGCGGIMRTAPIALYGAIGNHLGLKRTMMISAEAARLTHQHPLGFMPSAIEAYIIYQLVSWEQCSLEDFKVLIEYGVICARGLFPEYKREFNDLAEMIRNAVSLADNDLPDDVNIERIGGGWVGDEALAIALYCAVKHYGDFEKAVIAAVNHGGDSDSTGAVLGNILGTAVGYDAIPQHFKDGVELHDEVLHVADDLWRGEPTA